MNIKKWWESRQFQIKEQFRIKEEEMTKELERNYLKLKGDLSKGHDELKQKLRDIERETEQANYLKEKLSKEKEDLERANKDLRDQIKLIEAKARPDQVWASAFSEGFSKAWDMMQPLMTKGLDKMIESERAKEIENSVSRLDVMVSQRCEELKLFQLRDINELRRKRQEFLTKKDQAKKEDEIKKYTYFVQCLDWILEPQGTNGN